MVHQEQDNIKVKLSVAEAELLRNIVSVSIENQDAKFYIFGSRKLYSELLDELSDKLSEIGLNKDDEPNEVGLKIESLIDKFSPFVYG
tara:strand:- start:223 stop:486 length:264 start_codon:yes stop_codon:yes gene_type:complete